ncbi:hypothetical protein JKP88DRAFT_181652 [Tribonema minus]|uniref:Uncharacterized protein n=1 Tax=Tribonema minus TaxID=303371 RepID=A0A835YZU6_9STRA|nr:hypothetical protein JKP88DRAFT_181652 [Tribonema minus]
MCWSLHISVLTTICCWSIGGYLIKRNVRWDRANGVWTIAVAAVQVADAFLWWDGMEVTPEGKCKCGTTNWIVSFLALPAILQLHSVVRQAELRFKAVPKTTLLVAALGLLGLLTLPPELGPAGSIDYTLTHGCATPLPGDKWGSPVWGGKEIPVFHFVAYSYFIAFPLWFSSRTGELTVGLAILASVFTFPGAYGSKWCSVATVLTVYYLFHSGPCVLPIHAKAAYMGHASSETSSTTSTSSSSSASDVPVVKRNGYSAAAQRAADRYMHFLYGTAKMDA